MQTAISYNDAAPFWDKIAPKYAKKPVADPAAYEEKLARVGALLRAEDRVLEIGCGTGSTALRLAPRVAEITATDISNEMIAIAEKKRADAMVANVSFRKAAANERLVEAPFDVITAFSLLHLVDDVPEALDAVFAQIRPGGLFISKTVCLDDAPVFLRLFVRALRLIGIAPKVTMLSKNDLHKALVKAGFDILESRYFGKGRLNPFIIAKRPI
ncbi:class I SAM-dependent methyltransferase [Cognatiyoonia sp. IB215182]|uniref:class I SAM-dependent methyltransferase n=1 Tax=Cognatiyoonia sp. IB215182 TaxID=3097353 RepID=UPI002A184A1B|nr:class I SAM-dependent methyltransferase [Cognatiyoonia sp. IB215182]MDX8352952.1 class I SAM-dependent methyltransferase [Cognatiyoonia sp. IB215182]